MQTHELIQGTPEWHAHRAGHLNASDAAAMLGISPYKSRQELIRERATGATREHDAATMARFQAGHDAEAKARGIAESFLMEDLYPATVSEEIGGLPLSASLDGITMDEAVTWEHKLANAELLAAVRAGTIPEAYRPQLEQGLMISGAERCLFMVSDGTDANCAHAWYVADANLRAQILAGWKQFLLDVEAYVPQEVIPAPVVAAPDELPALLVELVGEVRSTNLATWQSTVVARIQAISTDLQSDEDFAVAERTVKFLDDGEKRLDMVKSQALAQTASIDDLFRTIDALKSKMRAKRLNLDKLVKARKKSIRAEIVAEGVKAFADHISGLNAQIGRPYMPKVPADFAGAIKGKKSVKSLRDAVADELARGKIEANEIAGRIQINLKVLRERAADHVQLFPDAAQIVLKAPEDLDTLITARIAEHAEKMEAERQRIAEQERARAEAAAKPVVTPDADPVATPSPAENKPQTKTHKGVVFVDADELRRHIDARLNVMNAEELQRVLAFIASMRVAA